MAKDVSTKTEAETDKGGLIEQVLIKGDLSSLSPEQRSTYYMRVCESVGLNMLTKPFEYITLNGKLTLYALRSCTDQLRNIHKVSVEELAETEREGVFIVTAKVKNGEGRTDIAKGAVNIGGLKGEALANAMMKAETKAKRRATLSICGLGMLDEIEVEGIQQEGITAKQAYGSIKLMKEKFTEIASAINACKSNDELNSVFMAYKLDFNNFRAIDETMFDNLCQLGQNRRDLIDSEESDKRLDREMDAKIA